MSFHKKFKPLFSFPETNVLDKTHCFIFQDDHLIHLEKNSLITSYELYKNIEPYINQKVFLGEYEATPYLACEFDGDLSTFPELRSTFLKEAYSQLDDTQLRLANYGIQLLHWERNHKFCGRCGKPTYSAQNDRAKVCSACQHQTYPRISPAILVAIEKNDKILLARSSHFRPGLYSILAGFVDPGENIEQAVHREIYEEVGLEVKNLRYFASDAWPFPDSLMISFTAEYASGEITLDNKEIEAAAWFDKNNLPATLPIPISLSWKLIQNFLQKK
jgi:NAD+ diphosphatase